jgi:uncharacterized membrane protein YedE/YeeE
MEVFLAIFLGTLFGFVLHRVGASNPENILNMLRLTDLNLMKAIVFLLMTAGAIDSGHLSVKDSYVGVIIGGAILGLGFGSAGYCPGTGLAGLGDGRRDAVAFVLGGLVGAFGYMVTYPAWKASGLLDPIAGGKTTLAVTGNDAYGALLTGVPGWVVALVIGLVFVAIAWALPGSPGQGSRTLPRGIPVH